MWNLFELFSFFLAAFFIVLNFYTLFYHYFVIFCFHLLPLSFTSHSLHFFLLIFISLHIYLTISYFYFLLIISNLPIALFFPPSLSITIIPFPPFLSLLSWHSPFSILYYPFPSLCFASACPSSPFLSPKYKCSCVLPKSSVVILLLTPEGECCFLLVFLELTRF